MREAPVTALTLLRRSGLKPVNIPAGVDVKVEGNVLLEGNGGVFGAALNTEQSYIKGKIGSSGSGSTRLLLANGARWDNQSVGIGGDTIGRSRLTYLKSDGGAIHQNDTQDLTIDKFEGKAKLFYKH